MLQLDIADIETTRAKLVERRVEVSKVTRSSAYRRRVRCASCSRM
jgi:hypothetical protein